MIFRGRQELLRSFRDGTRAALEEVYWAYVDRVEHVLRMGFVVAATGTHVPGAGQDHAERADLLQEVFARAFAPAARLAYDGIRDYAPYLDTIARNLLVDRARKRGREIPALDVEQAAAPSPADTDDAPWADSQTMALVARYLEGLPEDLKVVHEARYVRCLSQRDAATALGISRQNLRTLEDRLRTGLRRELKRSELR